MCQAIKADPRYYLVMAIVRGIYMPATLWLSFSHIVTLGHMSGLTGSQAYMAPFLVDGFAVLGMVFRTLPDAGTRKFGVWMQAVAGIASFAANVAAGTTTGERVFGALVVVAFVVAEQAGHVMAKNRKARTATAAAPVVEIREVIVEVQAAVDEATAKRHAANEKRRFNAAVKREVARITAQQADATALELAEMAAGFVPADAPVSPATGADFRQYP